MHFPWTPPKRSVRRLLQKLQKSPVAIRPRIKLEPSSENNLSNQEAKSRGAQPPTRKATLLNDTHSCGGDFDMILVAVNLHSKASMIFPMC
jgi:hypothetical protein